MTFSPRNQWCLIVMTAVVCYVPFINKALCIDADMLVHTSRQFLVNAVDPPLGEYGRHMVLHDHTKMPETSVFYRTGHPPLLPLLLAPVIAVAGGREWPVHALLFAFYLMSIAAVWQLLGLFYARTEFRFCGTLLWTVSPALMVNSSNIMWDVPITGLVLLSLALFIKGLRSERPSEIFWSGLLAGCAALTKVNALPLFIVCPAALILARRTRYLPYWLLPAVLLPMLWVVHNLIVYKKIHYISIGWYNWDPRDIRYRMERNVGYFGGALMLPLFWVWLLAARRRFLDLAVFLAAGASWGVLLAAVLKYSPLFCSSYALFAAAGLWLICKTALYYRAPPNGTGRENEPALISAFFLLYLGILVIMPSASVRYILPVVPLGLFVFFEELAHFTERHRRAFLFSAVAANLLLSAGLSVGDYLHAEADRRLPEILKSRGYRPAATWYYGRMGFDWYMHRAGFRNLRVSAGRPEPGMYAVNQTLPGDYPLDFMLKRDFRLTTVPIDTISLFRWPFFTIGFGAGFYGENRLPYGLYFSEPQRRFVVYRIE